MKSGIDRIGHDITPEAAKRGCFGKARYPKKTTARDVSTKLREKHPDSPPQRPYRCSLCNGYHLTSQIPNGLKFRAKEDQRKRA